MLAHYSPAKCLQKLQWDSSVPEQDQDQCNKTVGMGMGWCGGKYTTQEGGEK